MAFVADFGTLNFHLKTKFDMENKTSTNHENGNDANRLLVDGRLPIFHVKMDRHKFGLSEEGAMLQDMAEEYAVVADEKANAGLIVYGKYSGVWRVNPWSTRFLIRILLENSGVSLPPFH